MPVAQVVHTQCPQSKLGSWPSWLHTMQTSEGVVVETSISWLRCSSASLASPSRFQSPVDRSRHWFARSSELNMFVVSWRQSPSLFNASVLLVQFWSGLARQMPAARFLADAVHPRSICGRAIPQSTTPLSLLAASVAFDSRVRVEVICNSIFRLLYLLLDHARTRRPVPTLTEGGRQSLHPADMSHSVPLSLYFRCHTPRNASRRIMLFGRTPRHCEGREGRAHGANGMGMPTWSRSSSTECVVRR